MVTVVKHEWHQVDRQLCYEFDEDTLREIYPDHDDDEIATLLKQLEMEEADIDQIINDAWENDVEIEWEHQYDDCWTDRKGGYDVTYEYGDDSSWYVEPENPDTHKCTKCKWAGKEYDADWKWSDGDGADLDKPVKVCPMCESSLELTPEGVGAEEKRQKIMQSLDADDTEE